MNSETAGAGPFALAPDAVRLGPGWFELPLPNVIERDTYEHDGQVLEFYCWSHRDDPESHAGLQEELIDGERRWILHHGPDLDEYPSRALGLRALWRSPIHVEVFADTEEP